jgi:hypothetical protein
MNNPGYATVIVEGAASIDARVEFAGGLGYEGRPT